MLMKRRKKIKEIPYANAIGCLMYLMMYTRSDLGHSASIVSKYLGNLSIVY